MSQSFCMSRSLVHFLPPGIVTTPPPAPRPPRTPAPTARASSTASPWATAVPSPSPSPTASWPTTSSCVMPRTILHPVGRQSSLSFPLTPPHYLTFSSTQDRSFPRSFLRETYILPLSCTDHHLWFMCASLTSAISKSIWHSPFPLWLLMYSQVDAWSGWSGQDGLPLLMPPIVKQLLLHAGVPALFVGSRLATTTIIDTILTSIINLSQNVLGISQTFVLSSNGVPL